MMMRLGSRSGQRGFILVTVYMLLPIFIILAGVMVASAIGEIHASQRSQASTQALYLAEAGIDDAIVQLRGNNVWLGGSGVLGSQGTYSVAVASLSATRINLTAVGNSTLLPDSVTRTVEAIVDVTPNPLFRFAMFGNRSVTLNGQVQIDSYDSSKGAYGGVNKGSQGDVGTNGTTSSVVRLNGNVTVKGNALVGPGADPATAITMTNNDVITGTRSAQSSAFVLPAITIPPGLANGGALSISGNTTKTYAGGTYYWNSISISGNGKLTFTGPATVYLKEKLTVSGKGISTASNKPPNLIVYVQGIAANPTVSLSGNANFYGAIYAPNSSVNLNGNGALYGAVIGKTVTNSGNGNIHYDTSTRAAVAGSGSTVQVRSWQDVS